jgi:lipooligosaccharide transport system permease protein
VSTGLVVRVLPPALLGARRSALWVERQWVASRRIWLVLVSGAFEPLLYLLAIGVGVGALVGDVTYGGQPVPYASWVAPAMLAASAMNGAVYETTGNVFFRMRYSKVYDGALATPLEPRDLALGELIWALLRGAAYAVSFAVVMAVLGLMESWWSLLLVPAALLIGLAFAGLGLYAVTFMRSWTDLDLVQLVTLPLFLFSATFVPLDDYPAWAEPIVVVTPLYQGVALLRDLSLGSVGPATLGHVAYLVVLGLTGLALAGRRFSRMLVR